MAARAWLCCHVTTLRRAWVTWWALSRGVFGLREGFLLIWTHDVLRNIHEVALAILLHGLTKLLRSAALRGIELVTRVCIHISHVDISIDNG